MNLEARAKQIFLDALEREVPERECFLAERCAGDERLLARVHALLVRAAGSGDLGPGSWIGPYRLVEPLGEGGFGAVYLAEQERPVKRRVALKLLKLGMDSRRVIARFDLELQVLARMDHPNIAKMLDAGTTERGRPYFVMECVDGVALTRCCSERSLPLEARLELFLAVCGAVQHAHHRGVLHRDLKPSNVLVTAVDGRLVPKVIDFGVAKALVEDGEERTLMTRAGQLLGTPAYMSPEQLAGEGDVETRSDVYTLGVVLYELLTGAVPFAPSALGFEAFRAAVRDRDPPRPSTAARQGATAGLPSVPAELDWIVLRCLAKERERRYGSVAALAEDLERFLRHEAVRAVPPSHLYRARKFVRRHRVGSAAAAAVLIAVGLGAALAVDGSIEARRHARVAAAVNDFFVRDLLPAVRPSALPGTGREVTLREVLDAASRRIEADTTRGGRFHGEPLVEAALRSSIGGSYLALGVLDVAERHLARAEQLRRAALSAADGALLATLVSRAEALRGLGRFDEAEQLCREALDALERRHGARHEATVSARLGLVTVLGATGRTEEAERLCRQILEIVPDDEQLEHQQTRMTVGVALSRLGEPEEAYALFRRTLAVMEGTRGPGDPDLLVARVNAAVAVRAAGMRAEATRQFAEAYDGLRHVMGPSHPDTIATGIFFGSSLFQEGDTGAADEVLTSAADASRGVHGPRHLSTIGALGVLAQVRRAQGRLAEAEALTREALDAAVASLGEAHPMTSALTNDLCAELREQGRDDEAESALRLAVERAEKTFGAEHPKARAVRAMQAAFVEQRAADVEVGPREQP